MILEKPYVQWGLRVVWLCIWAWLGVFLVMDGGFVSGEREYGDDDSWHWCHPVFPYWGTVYALVQSVFFSLSLSPRSFSLSSRYKLIMKMHSLLILS